MKRNLRDVWLSGAAVALVTSLAVAACSARDLSQYESGGAGSGGGSNGGSAGSSEGGSAGEQSGGGGKGGSFGGGGFNPGGGGSSGSSACNPPCSNPPLCNPDTQTCVECLDNTDCPQSQPHCQNKTQCRECLFDNDCGSGYDCANYHCVKTCSGDGDCAGTNTPRCKTSSGICVECLSSSDCNFGVCRSDNTCGSD